MHTLDKLCTALQATYSITRDPDLPTVRVVVLLPSGDSMAGNGATTAAAVADLVEKAQKFQLVPEGVTL
jgi:hypothetical protein